MGGGLGGFGAKGGGGGWSGLGLKSFSFNFIFWLEVAELALFMVDIISLGLSLVGISLVDVGCQSSVNVPSLFLVWNVGLRGRLQSNDGFWTASSPPINHFSR